VERPFVKFDALAGLVLVLKADGTREPVGFDAGGACSVCAGTRQPRGKTRASPLSMAPPNACKVGPSRIWVREASHSVVWAHERNLASVMCLTRRFVRPMLNSSDDMDGAARARAGTAVGLFADGGDLLADLGDVLLVLDGAPVVGSEGGCGQPVLQRRHEACAGGLEFCVREVAVNAHGRNDNRSLRNCWLELFTKTVPLITPTSTRE